MQTRFTKEKILEDIEAIYQHALGNHKWNTALKAKEAQARLLGYFRPKRLPDIVRIRDMNQGELDEFLERLEKNEPGLQALDLPKRGASREELARYYPSLKDLLPPEAEAGEDDSTTHSAPAYSIPVQANAPAETSLRTYPPVPTPPVRPSHFPEGRPYGGQAPEPWDDIGPPPYGT